MCQVLPKQSFGIWIAHCGASKEFTKFCNSGGPAPLAGLLGMGEGVAAGGDPDFLEDTGTLLDLHSSAEIFARKHRGTLAGLYGRWRQLKYDYECIRRGDRAFNERAGARAVRSDGFAALRPNLFTGGARRSRG